MVKVKSKIINRDYYIDPIPLHMSEVIDLANKHWPTQNENLWIGDIDKSYFSLSDVNHVNLLLKSFFQFRYYKFDIETINVDQGEIPPLEQTCKMCYLITEWVKKKSFRDPICTHYNPRLGTHVVHPGGTRQSILNLFHTGPIKTFYFNTGGFDFDFLSSMTKVSVESVIEDQYSISLVPDHGTLIPHILKPVGGTMDLPPNMIAAHNHYKTRLTDPNYKIFSNSKISYLEKWTTENPVKASTMLTFKEDSPTLKSKIKATLLTLSGSNYNDEELKVFHRNIV